MKLFEVLTKDEKRIKFKRGLNKSRLLRNVKDKQFKKPEPKLGIEMS